MLSFRNLQPYQHYKHYTHLLAIHNIRWLLITRFFSNLFFYSTIIVAFQHSRGLNYTEMFLMESIISATIWLTDIPTGIWADRVGYRQVIIVGQLVFFAGSILYFFSYGFWLFALSNILAGFAIACFSGCISAFLYQSVPIEQKAQSASSAFVLLEVASSAGFFLGLFAGSFIGAYSPTLAVAISIIPAFLAIFAALPLRNTSETNKTQSNKSIIGMRDLSKQTLQIIRAQPVLVALSFFSTSVFACVNAIFWYNQPYLTRAGIAVQWFGPIMALAVGTKIVYGLQLSYVQSHIGTRLALALTCLVPGIAYILLTLLHTPILVIACIALIVVFPTWNTPIVQTLLNAKIHDESRATTLSTLSFLGTIAGIVLNVLIGYAGDSGLAVTGLSLGVALLLLCGTVPFIVREK